MIKVYGVAMSRAQRALWMLEELGLPYEHVKTSFAGDTRKPEFLKLNPNGHIPVLDDDGLIVWESMAINLHLAMKYGAGKLWPASPADQAHTLQWSFWAMTEAEPPLMTALLNRVMLPPDKRDAKKAEEATAAFQAPLRVLDGALAGRDYLLGSQFGVADLNVASTVGLVGMVGIDVSGAKNAAAWLARCQGRPALARARSK
jgi:glutathione S-transferase